MHRVFQDFVIHLYRLNPHPRAQPDPLQATRQVRPGPPHRQGCFGLVADLRGQKPVAAHGRQRDRVGKAQNRWLFSEAISTALGLGSDLQPHPVRAMRRARMVLPEPGGPLSMML
jgi:hypothetical protein